MKCCTNCKEEHEIETKQCPACLEKSRTYQRTRRKTLIDRGKCPTCTNDNPTRFAKCDACREKQQIDAKRRQERLNLEGRCIICGKAREGKGVRCDACRDKNNANNLKYRQREAERKIASVFGEMTDGRLLVTKVVHDIVYQPD